MDADFEDKFKRHIDSCREANKEFFENNLCVIYTKIETNYEDKYKRHLENCRKANKKFFENNKELVNERCKKYYEKNLKNNEEYKEKKRLYARNRYLKKKEQKIKQQMELIEA